MFKGKGIELKKKEVLLFERGIIRLYKGLKKREILKGETK